MHRSLNRAELIGRLGEDPQAYSVANAPSVCVLWIVSEESWRDADGGISEIIEWIPVVAWGRIGEECYQFLIRGDTVYVEGHLSGRTWQRNIEQAQSIIEVAATRVLLLRRNTADPADGDDYIPEDQSGIRTVYVPPTLPDARTQHELRISEL